MQICEYSFRKQLYTYLATLGAITLLSMVQCHRSPSSIRFIHNSRKSHLYTYLGSAGHLVLPSSVTECNEVCT